MSFSVRLRALSVVIAAMTGLLSGCGGGGGGGESPTAPPVATPYAPLTQDDIPTGARVALDMSQPYPLDEGTHWSYAQVGANGQALDDVERIVVAKEASGYTRIREVSGRDSSEELLRWAADGLASADPLDVQAMLPGLAAMLAQWIDVPTPAYPVNSVRRAIRQGDLGADLDGDGRFETFRAELAQTNLGFEEIQALGQTRRVLHLRTQFQVTIAASKGTPMTLNATEDSFLADGFGPLRLERKSSTSAIGTSPATSESSVLTLKRLRRQGAEWTSSGLSFSVGINARGLVYDAKRQLFLAAVDWAAGNPGTEQTIATIDPRTGRVSYSAPLPDAPSSMAMAADGDSVYVLMERSRDVRRLALPGLTEISRTPWPLGADGQALAATSLLASPTAADTFAITALPRGFTRPGTVHLARNGQWVGDKLTVPGNNGVSAAFAADGAALFAINETTLVRALLPAAGPMEAQRVAVDGAGQLSAYPGRLIAGRQVYGADAAMAWVGTVAGANDTTPCTPLPALGKIVCQDNLSYSVTVADAQTLAKLGSANYNHVSMSLGVRFVPGPPGILAVAEYQRLVVFASDLLR